MVITLLLLLWPMILTSNIVIIQGEAFAREHGLIFMETSAKTAANVEEVNIVLDGTKNDIETAQFKRII